VSRSPSWTVMHLIWHSRRGRRRNHLWQMFWWSVEGCRFCGGRKLPFPIDKASRVNTGLALPRSLWLCPYFANAPRTTTDKLQRVLNAAARVITGTRKFDRDLTVWRTSSTTNGWTFRNGSRRTSLSFVCQSRTSLVVANFAVQSENVTFLVTTCQTTADARFRTPALTPGTSLTCWKCAEIDIYSHLQTLSTDFFYSSRLRIQRIWDDSLRLMGYTSVLSNSRPYFNNTVSAI